MPCRHTRARCSCSISHTRPMPIRSSKRAVAQVPLSRSPMPRLSSTRMEGKAIPITLSQFLIGRDPQCHLRPTSPLISKRHCAVVVKGGKVFVRDFQSTNGTLVNDRPVDNECEVHDKDRLKVGPLEFQLQVEGIPAFEKPTPLPATDTPADMAMAWARELVPGRARLRPSPVSACHTVRTEPRPPGSRGNTPRVTASAGAAPRSAPG